MPGTFVSCMAETYPARPIFQPFAEKGRLAGWDVTELQTGHDCHVEQSEVASILLATAASKRNAVSG